MRDKREILTRVRKQMERPVFIFSEFCPCKTCTQMRLFRDIDNALAVEQHEKRATDD